MAVAVVREAQVVDKDAPAGPEKKTLSSQAEAQAAPQIPKVSFDRDEACKRLTETTAAFLQEIQASYPEIIELPADQAVLRYVRGMANSGLLVDITIRKF